MIYVFLAFFIETVDGDKWADNLKVPTGIQLDNPIDITMDHKRPDSGGKERRLFQKNYKIEGWMR